MSRTARTMIPAPSSDRHTAATIPGGSKKRWRACPAQLDPGEEADAPDLADQRVVSQRRQYLEVGADVVPNPLDQPLPLDDLKVRQRHGGGDGMAQ